jgi:hypothetical protein
VSAVGPQAADYSNQEMLLRPAAMPACLLARLLACLPAGVTRDHPHLCTRLLMWTLRQLWWCLWGLQTQQGVINESHVQGSGCGTYQQT